MVKKAQQESTGIKAFYREWFAPRPKPSPDSPAVPYTGFKKLWHDWLWPLIWAIVVVKLLINPFLLQAHQVPTGSMEKTILPGEWLMTDKLTYGLNIPFTDKFLFHLTSPRPGQIVVFESPYDGLTLVKRCIGKQGDTVEVRHKKLFINGREMDEPYVQHSDETEYPMPSGTIDQHLLQRYWEGGRLARDQVYWVRDNFGPVIVPKDCFFMMGDNRDNSFDSRFWGPLHRGKVRGRSLITYWSWDLSPDIPAWKIWQRFRLKRLGRILI